MYIDKIRTTAKATLEKRTMTSKYLTRMNAGTDHRHDAATHITNEKSHMSPQKAVKKENKANGLEEELFLHGGKLHLLEVEL